MDRSDFIIISSSDSEMKTASETLSDTDSDIAVDSLSSGGSGEEIRGFVKKFTKRDLKILYLPVWFIRVAKMEMCRTTFVRYGDNEDTDAVVRVNQRKPPREAMYELHRTWQRFTSDNRMKAGRKYVIEFVPRERRRLEYIRVRPL